MLQRKTQWKALRRARTGTIFGTHSTWKTPRGRENMNTSKKSRERMKAIQHIHWLDDWGRYWVCPPKSGLGGQNGRVSNLSTEKRFGWREYVKRVSEESERREWVKRMSEESVCKKASQNFERLFWRRCGRDSNPRPPAWQAGILTSWTTAPCDFASGTSCRFLECGCKDRQFSLTCKLFYLISMIFFVWGTSCFWSFGMFTFKTPFTTEALIFSLSTSSGRAMICWNFEYENSRLR